METIDFFKIYVPALEQALLNDHINLGFYVRGPEDYILNDLVLNNVEEFMDKDAEYKYFFDLIGVYFDAKSHYFEAINGKLIDTVKIDILERLNEIKKKFNF